MLPKETNGGSGESGHWKHGSSRDDSKAHSMLSHIMRLLFPSPRIVVHMHPRYVHPSGDTTISAVVSRVGCGAKLGKPNSRVVLLCFDGFVSMYNMWFELVYSFI